MAAYFIVGQVLHGPRVILTTAKNLEDYVVI